MHSRRYGHLSILAMLVVLSLGCRELAESTGTERPERGRPAGSRDNSAAERVVIGFGVIAGNDPGLTYKGYQPLMDRLSSQTPFVVQLRLAGTPDDLLRNVEERMAEIVPLGIVSYLEAHIQFGAVPLVKPLNRDGEPSSRSVFIVRQGSPLQNLVDLRGHSLALGAFHSTLSNLLPRHELVRAGLSIEDLGSLELLDNDEAVASAVLEGRFDAGAVEDVVAYRHREKGLDVLHVSGPIPTAPLVIRDDLPQRVSRAIQEALLKLDFHDAKDREHWDEEIRYGFAPATDSDYDPVREIVKAIPKCAATCHGSL